MTTKWKVGDRCAVTWERQTLAGTVERIGKVLIVVRLDEPQPAIINGDHGEVAAVYRHEHEVYDLEATT